MYRILVCALTVLVCALAVLLGTPPRVAAQDIAVTGRVVDAGTIQPLASVQVFIPALDIGGLTGPNGRYLLTNVPAGTHEIRFGRIGYRTVSREVTIRTGATLELNVSLGEQAIELDEIIVTGTAGGVEKRALGNAVSTINSARLAERIAPPLDISRLINARAPGVFFQPFSGSMGMGGRVRLRGGASFSLPLEPLIYIDGVRVDNRAKTGPTTVRDPGSPGIYPSISRLNDINPEDIERVEIIKGPAASTLYGTEAANGVIQIFTKRGRPGPARWTASISAGPNWISSPETRWRQTFRERDDGSVYSFNLVETENARGTPIFRTAPLQRYSLGVSGGSEAVQYYLSTNYIRDEGVFKPNRVRRFQTDINLQSQVSPTLGLSLTAHYVSGRTTLAEENVTGGNSTIGSLNIPYRKVDPLTDAIRGFNVAPPEAWSVFDFHSDLDRYTVSLQVRHDPVSWFSHRLTTGRDLVYEDNIVQNEPLPAEIATYWPAVANGRRNVREVSSEFTTFDYSGTATARLTGSLSARTSVGAQFYRKEITSRTLDGQDFPAVGLRVVSSATIREIQEAFVTNTTVGMFVQEQLDWNNRLFLTAALRADDNSSFGADFDIVTYPKLSASWVLSEEPFFSVPLVSTLRLRAAFGASGQQPDAFAAIRTFSPIIGPGDTPAVRPNSPGNPNLGPERSEEFEAGFDAAILQDRVSAEFTFYNKRTKDLIVRQAIPPSSGFPGQQFINIGELRNRGIEAQVNAAVVESPSLTWNVGFILSQNSNKITSLDVPPIRAGANQRHVEGFPIGAFFGRLTLSADVVNGVVTNVMCDGGGGKNYTNPSGQAVPCADAPDVFVGKPLPTWEGAFNTQVTLFNRLTFSGLLDFKTGLTAFDNAGYMVCLSKHWCDVNFNPEKDPVAAGKFTLRREWASITPENRNFAKLRELSVSYLLPEEWLTGLGITSARAMLTARELYTWKGDYEGADPELVTATNGQWYYQVFHQIPPTTSLLATVRLTF